jgi:hypothetical protein
MHILEDFELLVKSTMGQSMRNSPVLENEKSRIMYLLRRIETVMKNKALCSLSL